MRFQIIVAGRASLAFAKSGVEEYLKRLARHGSYELKIIKAGDRESVSRRLLEASEGSYRIAMDERGKTPTTRRFSEQIEQLEMDGEVKAVAFLIGAADGHTAELRASCQMVLSLSAMTMQHELALVVLLEQLYRLATIKSGSPYHRD